MTDAKKRWTQLQKLWDMGLPVKFIIKISGHKNAASFKQHTKHLRQSWGDQWFSPRPRGFKPVYDLKTLV
jgi:hypothetical protein